MREALFPVFSAINRPAPARWKIGRVSTGQTKMKHRIIVATILLAGCHRPTEYSGPALHAAPETASAATQNSDVVNVPDAVIKPCEDAYNSGKLDPQGLSDCVSKGYAATKQKAKPAMVQWYAADFNHTSCIKTAGPGPRIKNIRDNGQDAQIKDQGNTVEVSVAINGFQETYWTYYNSLEACQRSLPASQNAQIPDRYFSPPSATADSSTALNGPASSRKPEVPPVHIGGKITLRLNQSLDAFAAEYPDASCVPQNGQTACEIRAPAQAECPSRQACSDMSFMFRNGMLSGFVAKYGRGESAEWNAVRDSVKAELGNPEHKEILSIAIDNWRTAGGLLSFLASNDFAISFDRDDAKNLSDDGAIGNAGGP